jgi:hypothetical protein
MKLLSLQRSLYPGNGRRRELAKFSIQINDDLRLIGLRLVEGP